MRPCYRVEIITPKKVLLNGLWFGPKKPANVILFIHGLTGSAFSMHGMVDALVGTQDSVVVFNNRGFEQISEVTKAAGKKHTYLPAGAGHEVFTECVDDIQGAINLAKKRGVRNIYLAGHSTGCQKALYWASKRNDKRVKGIILLGPLSDYAGAVAEDKKGILPQSVAYAQALVRAGKSHELMSKELGPWFVCDAQRFLSLYTPDSSEEIFSYAQPKKDPKILKSVRVPTLVLLAGEDEHADRPAEELKNWFDMNLKTKHQITVVPKVTHSFRGGEKQVKLAIKAFMKEN
jgi:pimeloyl-ACP methyl ester carboxylesterase